MSDVKEKSWKEIPRGGLILEAGNAQEYLTGGWRSKKPVWMSDKCIHCMTCWICCPDASIKVKDEKVVGIDYEHCKGCGICASVCPVKDKAIKMIREGEKDE
ncbi:MAG TPA: 4Fe-4S dicluster domain-containing protein [Candidatus Altiarchaeales archaeon]|nr:4Fe-4S dicluster domain-containing protein [Candidatus Altiarchaeales archaeon]